MKKILFVCYGNICRSPMAQGIFQKVVTEAGKATDFEIQSAGFHPKMSGKSYHPLTIATCQEKGISLEGTSRTVKAEDLEYFDIILAMDRSSLMDLRDLDKDSKFSGKLKLILEFSGPPDNVPDPIDGGKKEFAFVFSLLEEACQGFYQSLKN